MTEFALAFMPFMILTLGMFEFGRAYMVIQTLNAAARIGGRLGVTDNSTNAQMVTQMRGILSSGGVDPNKVKIYIFDGSGFDDSAGAPPSVDALVAATASTYNPANPGPNDFSVDEADPRQLFIIRMQVQYADVSVLPTPKWLGSARLIGQAVMRHE
ncbi:MAG TPA: TadE family protein [Pirellulales bacterium]